MEQLWDLSSLTVSRTSPVLYCVRLVSIIVFPERAGRVILDGVVNPIHWASEPQYQLWGCLCHGP